MDTRTNTDCFLFIGDSITDADRDREDASSWGLGFVRLVAERIVSEFPNATVVNAGVAGDRARDLEARWENDVTRLSPTVLTIYVGVNESLRRFDRGEVTEDTEFESTYRRLLEAVPSTVRRVIVIEPYIAPVRADQEGWLADVEGKRAVVARLAEEFGAIRVELAATVRAFSHEYGPSTFAPDGIHPSDQGSEIIAALWMDAARRHALL